MSRASCVTRHAHPDPSHAHGVACVGLRHPENVSAIADMDKRVHKVPKGETVLRLELTAYTHTQLWSSFKCAHTLLWSSFKCAKGFSAHLLLSSERSSSCRERTSAMNQSARA
eukprot:scaffold133279_cov69-Phaeocystis_antarctica.AAC.3